MFSFANNAARVLIPSLYCNEKNVKSVDVDYFLAIFFWKLILLYLGTQKDRVQYALHANATVKNEWIWMKV